MPSRTPTDYAGAWWHVTNRGLTKRTTFESGEDVERFLEILAACVAAGWIEIHAFAVLTTHFHLLVRSRTGELPRAMRWLLLTYVRWFNRTRKRDGSLFRGRYRARLIEDQVHWETVVRYIDLNAVRAKMCARPSEYPHGSARLYVSSRRPEWLSTVEVETSIAAWAGAAHYRPADHDAFSLSVSDELIRGLVEPRLSHQAHARTLPLTDLVRSASLRQQRWFEWKAGLADGTQPGVVLVPAAALLPILNRLPASTPTLRTLRVGMLRELSGAQLAEIAEHNGCAVSTVHGDLRRHQAACREDQSYRRLVERVVDLAVRRSLPAPRRQFDLPMSIPALSVSQRE